MADANDILTDIQDLADAAATAAVGDPITLARINAIASASDNFVQPQDGFHAIAFDDDVGDAAFVLSFDAASNIMKLRNLTSGEIASADLGSTAIAQNAEQDVRFESIGATITLNSAFDKTSDIGGGGGAFSGFGPSAIEESTVELLRATSSGAQELTSNTFFIDSSTASNAVISIDGYSATGVDLSIEGDKLATLTDGVDSFTISFEVTGAFSDTDDGALEVNGLGALIFADASVQAAPALNDATVTFAAVDMLLNGQSSGANRLEVADGFDSITFGTAVEAAAFAVSYDAAQGVLEVVNLTDGLAQTVNVDAATSLSVGETQTAIFEDIGVTIVLNDAFDKTIDIGDAGGAFSAVNGGADIRTDSIAIASASVSAADDLIDDVIAIDAETASSAVLSIGGYSGAADLESATGAVTVVLTDGTDAFEIVFELTSPFSDTDFGALDVNGFGQIVFSQPQGPADVVGTGQADLFTGTSVDDVARAGGGDDQFSGGAGDDLLNGQVGDDVLRGGAGDDTLFGGDGGDDIDGGDGADVARGGADDDVIAGGEGPDSLYGDDGDDAIDGGGGDDLVKGGAGGDVIEGGLGDDVLLGQAGDDVITNQGGQDQMRGGDGLDTLTGGDDADTLFGDAGDDTLAGGLGADVLKGGTGDDVLSGDGGDDVVLGEAGRDIAFGRAGADRIHGGDGDDVISGHAGDDLLFGEDGADSMTGGSGFDILTGGSGADVFRFVVGADEERIADFEDGVDKINMFSHGGISEFADLIVSAINGGADAKIAAAADPNGPDFLVLTGVAASAIDASDFQF